MCYSVIREEVAMKYRTRQKLRTLLTVGISGAAVGIVLANVQMGKLNPLSTLNGIVDGLLIGSTLAAYHLFFYDGGRTQFFRKLNFSLSLMVNSISYTALIIFSRTLGRLLTLEYANPMAAFEDPLLLETTVLVLLASLLVNAVFQASELIGSGELRRFVTGRYHRPKTEFRVFLFLDLVSSTSIAERIGSLSFLNLLDDFYRDLTEAILRSRAEIYKYVGDEIILTWTRSTASAR
ncbi:MAG: hypothetical protein CMN77_10705 [Spirochaetaceae bacterium]|nr:hypothetical protein [Spirochaetaceae bacterium]